MEKPTMLCLAVSSTPGTVGGGSVLEAKNKSVLAAVEKFREENPPPKKGAMKETLPIRVVCFHPETEGDEHVAAFFKKLGGEESVHSSFMVDTSQEDCMQMDKYLKSVAAKRKQLDKLRKKLEEMEDLSEKVGTDRKLLRSQQSFGKISFQRLPNTGGPLQDKLTEAAKHRRSSSKKQKTFSPFSGGD